MRNNRKQNAVRRYLLQQLSATEQQSLELRLLTDEQFAEELEFVENELIDEYLAGELSADERARFEEFFLAYPERKRKLQTSQAMKRYLDANPAPVTSRPAKFRFRPGWRAVFSIPVAVPVLMLGLVAIGLVIWRVAYKSDLEKGLTALNDAFRNARPVEARVSNLTYAPFDKTRGNEPANIDTLELDRAERFLSDAAKYRADAASYHALGKLFLLQKDPRKAIPYLEQAKGGDPKNAQVYADLAAAYLEKGRLELEAEQADANSGKGLEDLGRSLEYLNQALELNPDLLEALFNRALVHQHQGLYQQAEADWQSYLKKDPNSAWANEAQLNLKRLEEKKLKSQTQTDSLETFRKFYRAGDDEGAWEIYRRSHGTSGNQITRGLISDFLADVPKASDNLQALTWLGQLESRKTQDTYTSDLARVYVSATPQTRAQLAQARKDVAQGYNLIRDSKITEATELVVRARDIFQQAGDVPETIAAEAAIAHAAVIEPDLVRGPELLARLVRVTDTNNYKWLLAQCLTEQAHLDSNLNNYSQAIADGNHALQLFTKLGDLSGVLGTFLQLASLHLFLNDNQTSFSYLERALKIAEKEAALASDLWGIQIAISLNLSAHKLYRAALDYQKEALQLALPLDVPIYISRSYQYIGLSYGSLGRFDLALQNGRLAYDQGKPLSNERNGQNMLANAALRLGDLHRANNDPMSALSAYDESSRLYEALGFAHYSYAAHKGKFLSYVAQNNDAMAAQELFTVLSLFDEYREKILSERQKTFFFDREQDTYNLAIDFAYSHLHDPQLSFEYAERSRAQNLRELMFHGAEVTHDYGELDLRATRDNSAQKTLPALRFSEIQQRLPEPVQVVEYAVLDKKVLIWLVTRSNSIVTKSVDVDAAKLDEAVATTLNQIRQRDDNGTTASLKNLYHLLIEPISESLDPNKVVCFVPDKSLHYVPFGALISGSSSNYLLHDFQIMSAPSATILNTSTSEAATRASAKDERLLAIGNPTFDRRANPSLADLPDAQREVEQIASRYAPRRVLVRGDATRQSIMDELVRADVAHFAAHYEIDSKSSLASRLLVGSEPVERAHAQPTGLTAADIYRSRLTRTRLVILSACTTGIEQQFGGEGAIGFARSFLVAGVPVVVASWWPVDSDATAELMIAFHRFRKVDKLSTIEALRRAQRELIANGRYQLPYYWAGFMVVGGYSDF
jgi:CHAT domain-containing protein/TolA-binding protein